jgi:hypothetical protein
MYSMSSARADGGSAYTVVARDEEMDDGADKTRLLSTIDASEQQMREDTAKQFQRLQQQEEKVQSKRKQLAAMISAQQDGQRGSSVALPQARDQEPRRRGEALPPPSPSATLGKDCVARQLGWS